MKKIISIMLMCMFFALFLVACKQESTANLVAKNLDNNLNKLSVAVNNMDTIDNKYFSNPDLYSSIATPTKSKDKFFALTFAQKINSNNDVNDLIKQLLVNKIKQNLLNQNKTSYSDCYNCKKYCDNDGNCYYTDCNGNNYMCDTSGNCSTCPSIPSHCSYVGETNFSGCPNATQVSNQTQDDLLVEQLSIEQDIAKNNNQTDFTTLELTNKQKPVVVDNDSQEDKTTDNNENKDDTTNNESETNRPNVRVYYFTQESFTPNHLRYQPRYVNEYNENNINDQIETYLFKIQKLYAMTEDSIEANSILAECKNSVLDCIQEIKDLNNCILNGTCDPSTQQLEALNNYIDDIKTTISRLKNCNGDLNKEVNNINSTSNSSIVSGLDVLNSRYLKLLNHIDTRIAYHKSAIATLEQIKYLLEDSVNGTTINEQEILSIVNDSQLENSDKNQIKEIIDNIQDEKNLQNTNNTTSDTNTNSNVTNNDKIDNNGNNVDNNSNIYDNNSSIIDANTSTSNNENLNDFSQNSSTTIENNGTNSNEDNLISNNNINKNNNDYNSENIADSYQDTTVNFDAKNDADLYDTNNPAEYNNNTSVNDNNSTTTIHEEDNIDKESGLKSNIDTYNQSNLSNIDTYKNNISDDALDENQEDYQNTSDTNSNENFVETNNENTLDSNTNIDENFSQNPDFTGENYLYDNNNEVLQGNTDNNELLNGTTLDNGYVNSSLYNNSVITQNNLDTNNGNGGYFYTYDGEIKNIGIDNNSLGNNGNSIETNLNGNNNVNTYGYNTLLDIINQGTVNNGINTL